MGFITSLTSRNTRHRSEELRADHKGPIGNCHRTSCGTPKFLETLSLCLHIPGRHKGNGVGRHIRKHDHACTFQMLEDPLWFLRTCQTPGTVGPYGLT